MKDSAKFKIKQLIQYLQMHLIKHQTKAKSNGTNTVDVITDNKRF